MSEPNWALSRKRQRLTERAQIIQSIRSFFIDRGYLEVETPHRIPANAPEPHIDAVASGSCALHSSPELAMKRMEKMKAEHPIVGDVRAKGCLMGIELVKDKAGKEPFDAAGVSVYQKAFRKGLAWIPAGHILRMSPPIVVDDETLLKGLDMIDEAIGAAEKALT